MKSILVIGMGRFGQHLCENLGKLDNQIMAVDMQEERLEPVLPYDICFICIGNNFQNSLEVTSMIKEMGARYVVSKANRDIHARLLLKNGADEVVYPDRDVAEKAAVRYSANHVFDYTELSAGVSIYEILPLPAWAGKSIKDLNIRQVYGISIIGVKDTGGHMTMLPGADYVIEKDVHLMVLGRQEDAEKILRQLR